MLLYIGIGLALFSVLGLLILLVGWVAKAKRERKEEAKRQWEQQRQMIIQTGLKRTAQAKKEAEKAKEQAIQDEYHQLQVNAAALDAEIRLLQKSKTLLSQQGLEILEELELFIQKQELEKKLVELEMQGVRQLSLYNDISHEIEQIEARLEILNRGETARLIIEQQAEIRGRIEQLAQKQAITFEELKKDLEKQFTPVEVQNILLRAGNTAKEIIAMTAAVALGRGKQRLSLKSP